MKKLMIFFIVLFFVLNNAIAQTNSSDAVVGTWLVQDGSAKVKIENNHGKYFGKIVWIKNPNDANGRPLVDSKNPEVSLRNRPQMGLPLLSNFSFEEESLWTGGTIYNPDDGKTYSCKITMKDKQTIEVRGYVGISLFGQTEVWKRSQDISLK